MFGSLEKGVRILHALRIKYTLHFWYYILRLDNFIETHGIMKQCGINSKLQLFKVQTVSIHILHLSHHKWANYKPQYFIQLMVLEVGKSRMEGPHLMRAFHSRITWQKAADGKETPEVQRQKLRESDRWREGRSKKTHMRESPLLQ